MADTSPQLPRSATCARHDDSTSQLFSSSTSEPHVLHASCYQSWGQTLSQSDITVREATHMAPYVMVGSINSKETSTHGLGWTSDEVFTEIPRRWRIDSGHRGLDALAEFSVYFLLVAGFFLATFLAISQSSKQQRPVGIILGATYYILAVAGGSSICEAESGLDSRFTIIEVTTLAIEFGVLAAKKGFDLMASKMKARIEGDPMNNGMWDIAGLARRQRQRDAARKSSAVRVDFIERDSMAARDGFNMSGISSDCIFDGERFRFSSGSWVRVGPPPAFDEVGIRERAESDVSKPPPAYVP